MQVCFHCGAANSPGAKECHQCLATLIEDGDETATPAPGAVEHLSECPSCGYPADEDDTVCSNCNGSLLATEEIPRTHDRNITSRYDEFSEKVKGLRNGGLSREEFGKWLNQMRDMLNNRREHYVQFVKGSEFEDIDVDRLEVLQNDYFNEREEEVTLTMEGIFEFEEAMSLMASFAEDHNSEADVLDEALKMMWNGNEKCNEAIRMNREYRNQLEDDWGYM
jgi:predicted nucleic acid-binding Zn ribbon protein